jgi:hypothetical protein
VISGGAPAAAYNEGSLFMDTETVGPTRRGRRTALIVGLLAAGGIGGAVLAGTLSASAASDSPTSSAQASAYGSATGAPSGAPADARGANPVRSDEKSVSSDVAAKLKAAAVKAVPGGTVYRVETDAGDGTYEAHMTKSDGSRVTVKFDKNLTVTKVEEGMGAGDPAPGR